MTTFEKILAAVLFAAAAALLFLAVRHFRERGALLNNAWFYASARERETMDKKPYYRQSAIVFCLLGAVFAVDGVSVFPGMGRIRLLLIPLLPGAVLYAALSAARIARQGKK